MRRSFTVLEGTQKAKTASVVFLILKKTYLPAGSVIICSARGAVLQPDYGLSNPEFPNVVQMGEIYMCLLQNGEVRIHCFTVVNYQIPPITSVIPLVQTDIMLYVTSILKGQIGKWVYLQQESNKNLRTHSSQYNSVCY